VLKVRQKVLDNLAKEDFSVEFLAEEVNLSRTQLYRKVKALTGRSVSQFINLIKIEASKPLLREKNLTVSEIAYQMGFSDPNYFMRVFAKEEGMSAKEWQANS